jgi:hypothetical protein
MRSTAVADKKPEQLEIGCEGLRSSTRALARDLRSACALKVELMLSAVLAQACGIE